MNIRTRSALVLVLAVALAAAVAFPAVAGSAKADSKMAPASNTIVDVAVANGSFTTLVTALKATGLDAALAGPGPFTVFAPTDAAFAKLPAGTLESLLANPAKLAEILKYHVVAGKVTAADVAGLTSAKTLEGSNLSIDTSNGVKVNSATVTTPDVMASNGVIHVIDTVLIPTS